MLLLKALRFIRSAFNGMNHKTLTQSQSTWGLRTRFVSEVLLIYLQNVMPM